jgi:hypothetical protein
MDPATGRRASAFFAEATDPERIRAVVEQHLRAPGGAPGEVVACEVAFARRGSTRSLIQY